MDNLLTIDLEEWFAVEILSQRYTIDDWNDLPSTVESNVRRLLELFRRRNARATWFALGWIAARYPLLLQEIARDGHEIACHSYSHRRVDLMDQGTFRADTERAIEALEKATGERPAGYRAPSWSINARTAWAFETLADLGFVYDSSIFPIKHDIYGMPEGPRHAFKMTFDSGRELWELPASTFRLLGRNIPMAGGGFFRHSPYWYSRWLIRKLNRQGRPAVIYIHPWEFDPDPPHIDGLGSLQKLRSYGSTSILYYKFDRLLQDFSFITVGDFVRRHSKRRIGFR